VFRISLEVLVRFFVEALCVLDAANEHREDIPEDETAMSGLELRETSEGNADAPL
jgi:hypothetical protein